MKAISSQMKAVGHNVSTGFPNTEVHCGVCQCPSLQLCTAWFLCCNASVSKEYLQCNQARHRTAHMWRGGWRCHSWFAHMFASPSPAWHNWWHNWKLNRIELRARCSTVSLSWSSWIHARYEDNVTWGVQANGTPLRCQSGNRKWTRNSTTAISHLAVKESVWCSGLCSIRAGDSFENVHRGKVSALHQCTPHEWTKIWLWFTKIWLWCGCHPSLWSLTCQFRFFKAIASAELRIKIYLLTSSCFAIHKKKPRTCQIVKKKTTDDHCTYCKQAAEILAVWRVVGANNRHPRFA